MKNWVKIDNSSFSTGVHYTLTMNLKRKNSKTIIFPSILVTDVQ